jgi:hypothetical protein
MNWLILGTALFAGVILLLRWFIGAEPKIIFRMLKWTGLMLAVLFAVMLLLSGRLAWLWVALVGLLPWVSRLRMLGRFMRAARGPSKGRQSEVKTKFVIMRLDHDTGDMDGEVVLGPFTGQFLSNLSRDDVISMWRSAASDPQSASVLEAYLDRVHGDDWDRSRAGPTGEGSTSRGSTSGGSSGWGSRRSQAGPKGQGGGSMSVDEAYRILGLDTSATEAEIKRCHKDLMKKNHPDHGGSDYLASKINEAKELLLKMT